MEIELTSSSAATPTDAINRKMKHESHILCSSNASDTVHYLSSLHRHQSRLPRFSHSNQRSLRSPTSLFCKHPSRQVAVQANVQRRSVISSSPTPPESASTTCPSQQASPKKGGFAFSSKLTDSDVNKALTNLCKTSRGFSRKSTGSTRKPGYSRSKRDCSSLSVAFSASLSSDGDPDVELLDEKEEREEEKPFSKSWKDIPISVAIPRRRQFIAKKTGKMCPAQPYHAKHRTGRVSGINTALQHDASDFLGRDFSKV